MVIMNKIKGQGNMLEKDYFIKEGYKVQIKKNILPQGGENSYWNETRIFTSGYYQYGVYEYAKKIIKKNNKIKNVADIGCGVGTKLMKLIKPLGVEVTGIDQKEAIEYCRKVYREGSFLIDNFENPTFNGSKFDLIICSDVIEHLVEPDNLLNYIGRLCHNDSLIILSTPERDRFRGKDCMHSPMAEHVREWNWEEIETYVKSRGFSIIEHLYSPFIKFSFNPRIYKIIRRVKKSTKTMYTNQILLLQKFE